MITITLQKVINEQITAELWSSQLYLQMSYFLKHQGWDGFAKWMKVQSDEERKHATDMADYLTSRGGKVKLEMLNLVPEGWGSVKEVYEHSYKQECMVSKMIEKIVMHAIGERDIATENFFRKFVDEQVEEEDMFANIVEHIKNAGDSGLIVLDKDMGER